MAVLKRVPEEAPTDIRSRIEKPEATPAAQVPEPVAKLDGRSLLSTGRTVQFATRVHPAWKDRLHRLAQSRGWMYVEVLEKSLDALERELAREGTDGDRGDTGVPARRPPFLD